MSSESIPEYNEHLRAFTNAPQPTFDVFNASTGEVCAKVAISGKDHAEFALSQCAAIREHRSRWLTLEQRVAILEKLAVMMEYQQKDLAKLIALEGGKPLKDAKVEALRALQGIRKCTETISSEAGNVLPMGMYSNSAQRIAFTTKEPIGTVLAISAFNHPLNLIVHQVGAAIAAGCPCIVKPAANTPLCCLKFYDLLIEAGLPQSHVHVITAADHDVASMLVQDKRIAFLSFIGSAKVGWMLKSQINDGVRFALEHGGVAPVIVTKNANLNDAAKSITKGGYYHAGQVCVSAQRVYVEEAVAETFISSLKQEVETLVVGDASNADTDVGPLIRPSEVDRVEQWVNEAKEHGAMVITGGERAGERFYKPTILVNPPDTTTLSTHEAFGPVVCIYIYESLDDAISRANSLEVAFQAGVFSENINECLHIYRHLDASAVMINDHSAFREDNMPFAGLKKSGFGIGGIQYTIEEMQIAKLMVIKSDEIR